jgi:hypothetical protein
MQRSSGAGATAKVIDATEDCGERLPVVIADDEALPAEFGVRIVD